MAAYFFSQPCDKLSVTHVTNYRTHVPLTWQIIEPMWHPCVTHVTNNRTHVSPMWQIIESSWWRSNFRRKKDNEAEVSSVSHLSERTTLLRVAYWLLSNQSTDNEESKAMASWFSIPSSFHTCLIQLRLNLSQLRIGGTKCHSVTTITKKKTLLLLLGLGSGDFYCQRDTRLTYCTQALYTTTGIPLWIIYVR